MLTLKIKVIILTAVKVQVLELTPAQQISLHWADVASCLMHYEG